MALKQSESIPTEKGWPLLGILPSLLGQDPYEYLKTVMLKKGDCVKLSIGPQSVYLVSNPEYLQRILRDNYSNYRKPDMLYSASKELSANGLIVSTGDFWLRQRRMIQPHLHRKELFFLFSDIRDSIADVLDSWTSLSENHTEIDLGQKMGEISLNVITRTLFGKDILPAEDLTEVGLRVSRMIKYIGATIYSSMVPKWIPIPGRRQFLNDLNGTRKTVNLIIAKCREEKETSASLIKMLINSVDEETHEHMTEQQLFDEIMTIFVAGYESTATTFTWLGVVIQKYPHILKKLHQEIEQVLGDRPPSFDDIPRLTYVRQVFMEILRVYTVVPFLPRALNQPDHLGSYKLPANALTLVFYHGAHHNPDFWEDPEIFDPDRFAPERLAGQHPFAYIPFSAGPRKCAGDEFVMLEGPLIMAMLLQKYNIDVLPNQTFETHLGASMRPAHGVKATFLSRK